MPMKYESSNFILLPTFDTFYFANLIFLNVSHANIHIFLYVFFLIISSVGKCQFMSFVQFTFERLSQYCSYFF